jgi:CRP-like cAMP-binding protein
MSYLVMSDNLKIRLSENSSSNKLLGAIADADNTDLCAMERVTLHYGMVLQEPDQEIDHVYFIEDGLVSLLSVSSEGSTIEIGVVGSEGMVGIPAVLGGFSPYRAVVQIRGEAWRMQRKHITDEFLRNKVFHDILLRYTNSFLVRVAQSSICNCFHTLEERLSRWLLLARDSTDSDTLKVTHDVIARLIGTRRASVTVTAGLLQRAGLIRMSRGEIRILNRAGLESIACECYGIVREGVRRMYDS